MYGSQVGKLKSKVVALGNSWRFHRFYTLGVNDVRLGHIFCFNFIDMVVGLAFVGMVYRVVFLWLMFDL